MLRLEASGSLRGLVRNAGEKFGELFGTGWPEIDKGKVISFPNVSQKEEGLPAERPEALVNQ
jgi:hypothetical protein